MRVPSWRASSPRDATWPSFSRIPFCMVLGGQPDPTRSHLPRAAPRPCPRRAASPRARSPAGWLLLTLPSPPDVYTPGSGAEPRPLQSRGTIPPHRAPGPRRCRATLPPGTWAAEGAGSCAAPGEGQAESCDAIPRSARFSGADRDTRTQPARRRATQAVPWRLLPLQDTLAPTQTLRPRPRPPFPLRGLKSRSGPFSLTSRSPEGSPSQSLRSLDPFCRTQLSLSPKAPSCVCVRSQVDGGRCLRGACKSAFSACLGAIGRPLPVGIQPAPGFPSGIRTVQGRCGGEGRGPLFGALPRLPAPPSAPGSRWLWLREFSANTPRSPRAGFTGRRWGPWEPSNSCAGAVIP